MKRPLLAFNFSAHFSSTEELKYAEARREYTILGCVDYLDEGTKLSAGVVVIAYRNGHSWIFNPLLTPENLLHLKQPEPGRINIPMPSPPPGFADPSLVLSPPHKVLVGSARVLFPIGVNNYAS
jgi:hypothetical protein